MPHGAHLVDTGFLRVVLLRPEDPHNVGAAVRACANFGVSAPLVVSPAFEWNDDALKTIHVAAAGAVDFIGEPPCITQPVDAIADCRLVLGLTARKRHDRSLMTIDRYLQKVRHSVAAENFPIALLFGCESRGLNTAEVDFCHYLLTIGASSRFVSLNLGQAVAVTLSLMMRALKPVSLEAEGESECSTVKDWERLCDLLGDDAFKSPIAKNQLRSLLARACPTTAEMAMLYNLVRSPKKGK